MQLQIPAIYGIVSKTQLNELASTFVEAVLDHGQEINAAELLATLENFIKAVKSNEQLTASIRSEVEKFGRSTVTAKGTKIEVAETGTKYDYSNCNDADYLALLAEQDAINERVSQREDMLKKLPLGGIDMAMQTTGEIVRVYPAYKTSKSSYKVTLTK